MQDSENKVYLDINHSDIANQVLKGESYVEIGKVYYGNPKDKRQNSKELASIHKDPAGWFYIKFADGTINFFSKNYLICFERIKELYANEKFSNLFIKG